MSGVKRDNGELSQSTTAMAAIPERASTRPEPKRAADDALVGQCLGGRYRVVRRIGRGGMGDVFEARHEALNKRVALKLIRGDLPSNEMALARFEREAKAAAGLENDHVVNVMDYGQTETGEAYMVMELLEGQSLEQLVLREAPLEPGRAASIARQISKGLLAAHAAGVVHRDLKSANVFLIDRDGHDHVKLLDFGISKISEPGSDDVKLTSTGVVMGTPNYMSPEQARGESNIDHRADLYSLGVILFEMLTGDVPFHGTNFLEVAYKHTSVPPPAPGSVKPDHPIPPELEAIVLKCLEKEPSKRFQSAQELIAALPTPSSLPGGWSSGSVSAPGLVALAAASSRARDRRRTLALAVALACVVFAASAAIVYLATDEPADGAGPVDPSDAGATRDEARDAAPTPLTPAKLAPAPDAADARATAADAADAGPGETGVDASAPPPSPPPLRPVKTRPAKTETKTPPADSTPADLWKLDSNGGRAP